MLATATPDRLLPSTACDLQALLGADNAAAFDIGAACPGFVYALTVAEGLIASGQSRTVLVVGAEKLSTITDFTDRSTAILFGDGAGASVVRASSRPGRGILSTFLKSDGRLAPLLYRPGGGAADPISEKVVCERSHYMKMAGREVFKAAVLAMAEACDEALKRAGVTAEQIDLLIPHQANLRIIDATAKHAGIPMAKVMVNLDRYGNTSSASIPLALDQAIAEGRVGAGLADPAGRLRRRVHLGERRRPVVTVVMCPGQGAQQVGMGKDLAERFPVARDTFGAIDETLGVPALPPHVGGPRGRAHPDPQRPTRHPRPHGRGAGGGGASGSAWWPPGRGTASASTARTSPRARSPRRTRRGSSAAAAS